jgi:hypothetical protein
MGPVARQVEQNYFIIRCFYNVRSGAIKDQDNFAAVLNLAECAVHFVNTWHAIGGITVISTVDPRSMPFISVENHKWRYCLIQRIAASNNIDTLTLFWRSQCNRLMPSAE